ncbi:MAG TPA: hypothetical protein DET40_04300 [Lentisphaeria bacterium]|nr:MAG: hypothetical protein A2X45_11335 [Lentisphaerae bacterium GWF2_50_93]HCE42747.1 hypothetical protein [Lentisphaeria bacterium]
MKNKRYKKEIIWNRDDTPRELHFMLEELGRHYPISCAKVSNVLFRRSSEPSAVNPVSNNVIEFSTVPEAARGLSYILGGCKAAPLQKRSFEKTGAMLDCSRNAVPAVEYLKHWIRRLAMFGMDTFYLYLEDMYELEGEPFFGLQRGRYSAAEIREVDRYALDFGIELIPCIQTLGHMEQALRWECYYKISDAKNILLAGEDKTYDLIEKMVRFWTENVNTRRLHIGMDEAGNIGHGHYLKKNGFRPQKDIFIDHLNRVCSICLKYDRQPIIWSDMLFRITSPTGDYYDHKAGFSEPLFARLPENLQMVYWDYYHSDDKFCSEMIASHKGCRQLLVSPGIWSWGKPWYGREFTENNLPPLVKAARTHGIKEIFFTLWNDDGACGDLESSWCGIAMAADQVMGGESLPERFAAICGGDYELSRRLAGINDEFSAFGLLWDDPLYGLYWKKRRALDKTYWNKRLIAYEKVLQELKSAPPGYGAGDLQHLRRLTEFLAEKICLRQQLETIIENPGKAQMKKLELAFRRQAVRAKGLNASFRKIWLSRFKPFGLEVVQLRLATQAERNLETARRLKEISEGKGVGLLELSGPDLNCETYPDFTFRGNVSPSTII